jgi:hypothetical protein
MEKNQYLVPPRVGIGCDDKMSCSVGHIVVENNIANIAMLLLTSTYYRILEGKRYYHDIYKNIAKILPSDIIVNIAPRWKILQTHGHANTMFKN